MKALSIRQPWAWAILHAGKRVENRSWHCHYRGPLLIHASKGMTRAEYDDFAAFYGDGRDAFFAFDDLGRPPLPTLADLARGGIVGRAVIVDCVTESRDPWFFGPYGIVLDEVGPLPFRPFKGSLGFFDVPAADGA